MLGPCRNHEKDSAFIQIKTLIINRKIVESVNIYEITGYELDRLAEGSPATIELNFAIRLLSAAVTLLISLFSTEISSPKTFACFVAGLLITIIVGSFFFLKWFRKRKSVSSIINDIKQRKSADDSDLEVYHFASFLRQIRLLEKDNKFLAINWLKRSIFKNDAASIEALHICIDKHYLKVHKIDNPKRPGTKVACCKINSENKDVRKILDI